MSTNATNGTGMTVREEFGAREIATTAETAAAAVAAQATAAVQARFVMAERRPRSWDAVRVQLLRDCKRPGFAEVAKYAKPVGGKDDDGKPKKVEGPSIRFAEAAIRAMTNLLPEAMTIRDDEASRTVRVSLTDLESNVSYSKDVTIQKTVERRFLKKGQTAIKQRVNSYGDVVFLVEATDEDLLNKQNALESKALRGHAMRLLPGDILEECMAQVARTLRDEDAKDPDAAKKKLIDAFADLNVSPIALKEYLGHDVGTISPAELEDLRAVYVAIKDGETTWGAAMETREHAPDAKPETKPGDGTPSPTPKTAQELIDKHTKKKAPTREPAKGDDAKTAGFGDEGTQEKRKPEQVPTQSTCEACGRFESEGHKPNCPNGPDEPGAAG